MHLVLQFYYYAMSKFLLPNILAIANMALAIVLSIFICQIFLNADLSCQLLHNMPKQIDLTCLVSTAALLFKHLIVNKHTCMKSLSNCTVVLIWSDSVTKVGMACP